MIVNDQVAGLFLSPNKISQGLWRTKAGKMLILKKKIITINKVRKFKMFENCGCIYFQLIYWQYEATLTQIVGRRNLATQTRYLNTASYKMLSDLEFFLLVKSNFIYHLHIFIFQYITYLINLKIFTLEINKIDLKKKKKYIMTSLSNFSCSYFLFFFFCQAFSHLFNFNSFSLIFFQTIAFIFYCLNIFQHFIQKSTECISTV